MISVYLGDERFVFPDATRYCMDEHNNLDVMTGPDGDKPLSSFHRDHWDRVQVGEVDDGEA